VEGKPPDSGVRSELSGTARDVVQARDVSGGIHFHQFAAAIPRPRQLPGAQPVFVNQEKGLAALDAELSGSRAGLAVIVGMPGVGKTTLALHWSHRNQDRFPDGQLYLNLYGYDPAHQIGPLRALWGFLLALGVPRADLAVGVDEAAAQYRSVLAERRVLIVLDNVREAAQVRPLLPGDGGCAVLVTSRDHMSGLVAREAARRITLDVLPESDAIELLARLTRAERPNDQSNVLGQFAGLCARLPLALRIAAEHAISRQWSRLEDLVTELRGQSALWETLTVEERRYDDGMVAARSVFAWSYLALPAETARVFRLLALHPGPDFSEAAVAALTAVRLPRQALGMLVGAHLLEQHAADRYQFHDLIRSYAMGQARNEEPPERLRDASRRVLLWYLRSADAAQPWINPNEVRVQLDPMGDDERVPEAFGSYDEAVRWFDRERGNLVYAVQGAAEQGLHIIAWELAVVLRAFYMRFNTFDDWLAATEAGLRSAEVVDDLRGQAELLESLGMAYSQSFDLDKGEDYQRRALEIRRQYGDRSGMALSLNGLGLLQIRRHHLADAQHMFEEALRIYDALGDEHRVPVIRANLAEALIGMQRYREARVLIDAALTTFRERGDVSSQGNVLRLLSMAMRGVGDVGRALEAAEGAVELATAQHNVGREGYWLIEVGLVQRLAGRLADGLDSFQRAAILLHRVGHKVREAQAWDGEGEVRCALGHFAEAIGLHEKAVDVFRSLDARWLLVVALRNLAMALSAVGMGGEARDKAAEAMRLLTEFPDPSARQVAETLREIT
jgi:tetratricopeptide (TPR) repeat protein